MACELAAARPRWRVLAFFADSQEDESAPLEHPSVDRRFPPKRRRPADA
jgi:hypothetical protein